LLALSLVFEGAGRDLTALRSVDATAVWSMGYVVVLATFGGFGGWYALLRRYESTEVAPFAVLVPVSGLSAAWAVLGERPSPQQAIGCVVAMLGVALVVRAGSRAGTTSAGRNRPDQPPTTPTLSNVCPSIEPA
jgi:O-acetylserine/cysteine efflux transporter